MTTAKRPASKGKSPAQPKGSSAPKSTQVVKKPTPEPVQPPVEEAQPQLPVQPPVQTTEEAPRGKKKCQYCTNIKPLERGDGSIARLQGICGITRQYVWMTFVCDKFQYNQP